MWRYFNNNPVGRSVGDCAIRALSVVLDLTWEETFALVAAAAFGMGDMPSSNSVWGAVLRQNGFYKTVLPNTCPDCYTFADFAADHPTGTFVLGTGTHVAAVRDGDLIDAWDSSNEVPAFVWYKPQEGVDL